MSKFFVKVLWKYSICEGDKIYRWDKSHTLNWFKFVSTVQYNSEVDGQHTCKTLTFFAFAQKKPHVKSHVLSVFLLLLLYAVSLLCFALFWKKKIPTCVCVWVLCKSKNLNAFEVLQPKSAQNWDKLLQDVLYVSLSQSLPL